MEAAETVRAYELRLLRCTFSPPQPSHCPSHASGASSLDALIHSILCCLETGNYSLSLSSHAIPFLLPSSASLSPHDAYSLLLRQVQSFLMEDSADDSSTAPRVFLVVCVAVASLFCFVQSNLTGPLGESRQKALWEGSESQEWENWARNHLMSAGSDLIGKVSSLQYIVFAKMLLIQVRDLLFGTTLLSTFGISSISWWLLRVLLIHQRILDERSSSLFDLLQVFRGETLQHFGTLEKVKRYWSANLPDEEALTIVSSVNLEAGILDYIYGRMDSCRFHFQSAEATVGLQLSVTGILGFRTVHQVEPKAQMVLVTNTSSSNSVDNLAAVSASTQSDDSSTLKGSDILMTPRLFENGDCLENSAQRVQNGAAIAAPLTPIQQAVVLAQCLLIEKSTRHDEMQRWDMAPYIEAIDCQESSYCTICSFCDILRIRWESTRSRTKGRALEMMEKLVEAICKPSPGAAERLPISFAVYMPTIPALRKEYGELLVSCGLVGEAIKTFEDLELWDNLIYCNCLLGKKAAAVELIRTRLSERPKDPRLWCSLGDVTNDDACYEKALEVSSDKSARAKRSLARSAYNRGDYETSKILWESAMALNSLYPDGWFALGAAALKARDVDKALDSFTRAVQLDPENGEAWNNIACLHMIKKKSKESFIAFKEALKFKRDSWQMWENFSEVAFDVGNISQALEAMKMVLNITNNKRVDAELLGRIMRCLEERSFGENSESSGDVVLEKPLFGSWETQQLMDLVGKILQQVLRSESQAELWGLYARWHKMKGDLTMCCEALLKQVRSYQGSDLWKDMPRFKKFAYASLELCRVYMAISSSTGSHRELFTAEMHLKNVLRQAIDFLETEEFKDLQACLEEVKIKLQSD